MEYKFVGDGQDGRKRKAPYSACESCKRRKKRCSHVAHSSVVDSEGNTTQHTDSSPHRTADNERAQNRPQQAARFVGELNPEVTLSGEHTDDIGRPDRHYVGTWVEDEKTDSQHRRRSITPTRINHIVTSHPTRVDRQKWLLPSTSDQDALIRIFKARIQPLLPVLEDFNETPAMLLQAICLVSSKDERAKDYLRISGQILTVTEFTRLLFRDADDKIRNVRVSQVDRIHLIETYLLLSLHCEGSTGAEDSSHHLCQAIHHAQTIGLHLNQTVIDKSLGGNKDETSTSRGAKHRVRLYWCLWTLDRLNAARNGRPRILVNDDKGLEFMDSLSLFKPAAKLWMQISEILGRTIDLYSPAATVDREESLKIFPSSEEMLAGTSSRGAKIDHDMIATLELYYHSVAMLSCRLRLQAGKSQGSQFFLRRSLSASTICAMLGHITPMDLAPLPIIPYALSLTFLVVYQQFRRSKRKLGQAIALDQLRQCQRHLENIGPAWWQARNMAHIGQGVLEHLTRSQHALLRTSSVLESSTTAAVGASNNYPRPNDGRKEVISDQRPENAMAARRSMARTLSLDPDNGDFSGIDLDGNAFADINAVFGNLMDMNQFPENFDFAFADIGMGNNSEGLYS